MGHQRSSQVRKKVLIGGAVSEHLYTYINPPNERHLARVCQILADDGVIIYPTGINWAFACDAASKKAIDKINRIKGGDDKHAFSLICSDISMASTVSNIDHGLYRVLKRLWPGHYTVLLKRNRSLPKQIKDKRQIVGVRIPDSPLALAVVEKFGKPLVTSSLPPKKDGTFYHLGYEVFEDFASRGIDILLDLGEHLPGLESTIVDYSEGSPVIVREGAGDVSLIA
ncbi:MAG: L-threonylcarbamoyladenylate synthase [Oligoflexales bacterium]